MNEVKRAILLLIINGVLLTSVGAGLAAEISGEVVAVDASNCMFILKSGSITSTFNCEEGLSINEAKAGDKVTVHYSEEGGRKKASKITPTKKQVSVGC